MNRIVTTDYLHHKLIAAVEVNTPIPTVDTSRTVFVGSFALMTGVSWRALERGSESDAKAHKNDNPMFVLTSLIDGHPLTFPSRQRFWHVLTSLGSF